MEDERVVRASDSFPPGALSKKYRMTLKAKIYFLTSEDNYDIRGALNQSIETPRVIDRFERGSEQDLKRIGG